MFQSFSHNLQPLILKPAEGVSSQMAGNKRAMQLSNPIIHTLTGKELVAEDDCVPANKVVQLYYGEVGVKRSEIILTFNPALLQTCLVSCPQVLLCQSITGPIQEAQPLFLILQTFRKLDLKLLREQWSLAVLSPL